MRPTGSQEYAEKLQDPRWIAHSEAKKKSVSYVCKGCGCGEEAIPGIPRGFGMSTHHRFYPKDPFTDEFLYEPWDTPFEFLECLCVGCHRMRHFANTSISPNGRKAIRDFMILLPEETLYRIEWLSYRAGKIRLRWKFIPGVKIPCYDQILEICKYFPIPVVGGH